MWPALTTLLCMLPAPQAWLREAVADAAVAQVHAIDPAWEPAQRDCAGLVRFAYRRAFARLAPARLHSGMWHNHAQQPVDFADAATLVRDNFTLLGRDAAARQKLRSGDLLAFRQPAENSPDATYHLMLAVVAARRTWVVYHPGEARAAVRWGQMEALFAAAPSAWRPAPTNPAFLGYFRLKEWTDDAE